MQDTTDDVTVNEVTEEVKPKLKKGFALKQNRKNINRGGRPVGAKGKVVSDKEFINTILSKDVEALETLLKIMRTGANSEKMKIAFKLMDTSIELRKNGNVLSVKKKDGDNETEYNVTEDSGNASRYKSLKIV